MSIYALLGATGSTGSAILRCLLSQPPKHLTLNVFVRSRTKLEKAFPDLTSTTVITVNIIEGTTDDAPAMRECLKGVEVVMACIGSNSSTPKMSLIYDTTVAIVDALDAHRKNQGSAYKPPVVIQLRSASLNPVFKAAHPWVTRTVASFCFYHVYDDLDRACKLLASSAAEPSRLLDYIFVDPPSIHDADGMVPTGHKLIVEGKQEQALSYADLGVAFYELAERRNEFAGKAVGVTATGAVNQTWGVLVGYMLTGAKSRIWG